jgi:hypothetical protein
MQQRHQKFHQLGQIRPHFLRISNIFDDCLQLLYCQCAHPPVIRILQFCQQPRRHQR